MSPLRIFWFALFSTTLSAGVIENLNAEFLDAVRAQTPPPCLVARNLAMLHLAVFNTVKQCDAQGFPLEAQEVGARLSADQILTALFPSQSFSNPPSTHPQLSEVRTIAETQATKVLKSREDDGATTTLHYVPKAEPGQWRRTPPTFRPPELPHWGSLRPFLIPNIPQFRAPAPPALTSPEFDSELSTVRTLGGKESAERTKDQSLAATFWSDFSYTESPPGHWNDIASAICKEKNLTLIATARLFALINLAMADAGIACWDTKYHYNYWRPVTAIATLDPSSTWQPMLTSPPHPEYVSGHASFSGAAATILRLTFKTDSIAFHVSSDSLPGVKRHFTSLESCVQEICDSRVWGGIHYPISGKRGRELGEKIAETCFTRFQSE
jgi:hypothetical protein